MESALADQIRSLFEAQTQSVLRGVDEKFAELRVAMDSKLEAALNKKEAASGVTQRKLLASKASFSINRIHSEAEPFGSAISQLITSMF